MLHSIVKVSFYEKIQKNSKTFFQNGVQQYVKSHLSFEIITKNQSFLRSIL